MLVSQTKAVRKSSCSWTPNRKKKKLCSTPDFTFLLQVAFPLTFAISVTAAATCTCNRNQNKRRVSTRFRKKLLHLWSHLFTPLQKGYETRHNKLYHVSQAYNCGKSQGFVTSSPVQIYTSTLMWSMRAETCVHPLKENDLTLGEGWYFLLSECKEDKLQEEKNNLRRYDWDPHKEVKVRVYVSELLDESTDSAWQAMKLLLPS